MGEEEEARRRQDFIVGVGPRGGNHRCTNIERGGQTCEAITNDFLLLLSLLTHFFQRAKTNQRKKIRKKIKKKIRKKIKKK